MFAAIAAPSAVAASPHQAAASYISKHGADARRVQALVQTVQLALGVLSKSATQTNIDTAAQIAQTAHDRINDVRYNFTYSDGGALGDAEGLVLLGANDLKNSMGALVAYLGTPNAATLAHFTSQYRQAVGEWDQGVKKIWQLAGQSRPPAV